jgi:hypothetical protein
MSSVAPESNERTQEQIQLARNIISYLKKSSNQCLFRIGLAVETLSVEEIAEVVSGLMDTKEMDGTQWTNLAMQLPDVYATKIYRVARYCFKNSSTTTGKTKQKQLLRKVQHEVSSQVNESQRPANDSDRSGQEASSHGFYSYDEIIDRAACTQSARGKNNTLMIGSVDFGDDTSTRFQQVNDFASDEIVVTAPERSKPPKKGLVKVVPSQADRSKTLMSTPISQMSDSLRLSLTDKEEMETDPNEGSENRQSAVEVVENNFNPKATVPSTPSGIAESQRNGLREKRTIPSTVDSKRAAGLYPAGFQGCVDSESAVTRGFESDPSSVKKVYDDRVLLKKYEGDPEIEVYLTDRDDEDEIYEAIKDETA